MVDRDRPGYSVLIRRIAEVIGRHTDAVAGAATAEEAARRWTEAGFDDAEEVEDWLHARCFDAERARALELAGITPEQASIRTTAGRASYDDTIGYKLARGDLSIEEAKRIITSAFWSS